MTIPAPCPHFGACGGCSAQDVPYEEQLRRKTSELRELFAPYYEGLLDATPSPDVWHYRNIVDLTFGRKWYDQPPPPGFVRETLLGFKRKGRWFDPLDVQECLIGPQGLADLLAGVRRWREDQGVHAYDSRTHEGLLKVLLVRVGARTGQRMVVLLTGRGALDGDAFAEAVQTSWPADSIQRGVTEGRGGGLEAESIEVLHGAETIEEELRIPDADGERALRFRISPFSFFQTNTLATERLYGHLREGIRRASPRRLYDLYGGSGGIAFSCADLVQDIISVENVASASEDGRHNAHVNGIGNVRFITEKVKNYLLGLQREQDVMEEDSIAVVDPPRSGMTPKALRRLVELRPPRIVYVSCKPTVFARDELPALTEAYEVERVHAFDLFPHTPHVEAVAELVRK